MVSCDVWVASRPTGRPERPTDSTIASRAWLDQEARRASDDVGREDRRDESEGRDIVHDAAPDHIGDLRLPGRAVAAGDDRVVVDPTRPVMQAGTVDVGVYIPVRRPDGHLRRVIRARGRDPTAVRR